MTVMAMHGPWPRGGRVKWAGGRTKKKIVCEFDSWARKCKSHLVSTRAGSGERGVSNMVELRRDFLKPRETFFGKNPWRARGIEVRFDKRKWGCWGRWDGGKEVGVDFGGSGGF